jgi:hypothetical protein
MVEDEEPASPWEMGKGGGGFGSSFRSAQLVLSKWRYGIIIKICVKLSLKNRPSEVVFEVLARLKFTKLKKMISVNFSKQIMNCVILAEF